MSKGEKIALVTFGLFMAEAILHYNMGKNETLKNPKENKTWLPPTKALIRLGFVVGVFSILNGVMLKNID